MCNDIDMDSVLNLIKALADRNRLRALLALKGRELCVCQITELLSLAPSTVSKHLSLLSQAGLIESRKLGRWVYYRISDEAMRKYGNNILYVMNELKDDRIIEDDIKKLKEILKIDPEQLCKMQTRR